MTTKIKTPGITDANVTTDKILDANVTTDKILDANVTTAKLNLISTSGTPGATIKGTSGQTDGYLQLNCEENTHGIKLKSPPHSAAQSYTLTFPQSITNGYFLKTDGSGNLSFAEVNVDDTAWQSSIVTAATLSAVVGYGYWIDTTSNTCTITLPASANVGDEIKFADYARTWGTNKIIIDPNGLNYQGQDDSYTIEYSTTGQSLNIVYSGSTKGWIPFLDKEVADAPVAPATQKAILGYGGNTSGTSTANLVNSSGVIASDINITGKDRDYLAATSYGGDKAAFAYGYNGNDNASLNVKNLVNNSGVVAADVTGVGTARYSLAAASYGGDKGIFGYGKNASSNQLSMTNLINNSGVIATDVTGVGTGRYALAAARYGGDKAIFGFGIPNTGRTNVTNLVSNSGVVASNSTGVGTARASLAAAAYGGDKAIFGYGESTSASLATTNKVSNSGVVASDTSGVGTVRYSLTATDFGGDKALFFGGVPGPTAISNLVSNTGVVASNTSGASGVTGKSLLAGVGYSYSA